MSYTVIVPKPVQKQLDDLPNFVRNRALKELHFWLKTPSQWERLN